METGITKVLVALDGSENSFAAHRVAAVIAERFKAAMTILYVIPPGNIYASAMSEEFDAQLEREGRKQTEKAISMVKDEVEATSEVLRAKTSVAETIIERAAASKSDLIVIGTRGLGGFKRMVLGSVSSSVATHAHCPVLVVRTANYDERNPFRRVVVAVDGSDAASKATRFASRLCNALTSELTILHVIHIPASVYTTGVAAPIDQIEKDARELGTKYVKDAAAIAKSEGVQAKQEIIEDLQSPASGIRDYASKNEIELVVVGTRGLGGFKKLLLGSVASGVLSYVHCSVAVVR